MGPTPTTCALCVQRNMTGYDWILAIRVAVYSQAVRGPLDILKETWEAERESEESVVSYILSVQEEVAGMMELVKENSTKAKDSAEGMV